MAYNKNEKTRDNRLKSEKSNRYTFKWSYEYRHKAMTLPLLTSVISCVLMIFLCNNALKKNSPILEVILLVGFGVAFLLYNLGIFQNLIHHTEILPDKITIVLTDEGPGIADVSQAMQEGFSTAPDNIRALGFGAGMGLPNMKRYTDTMDIETELGKGTTITMTVNL